MSQRDSIRPAVATVLWATHPSYDRPHLVRAFPAIESVGYSIDEEVADAKEWMENWGDDSGWTYWTTTEHVPVPSGSPDDSEELR
jgi:hypothetical protein